MPIGLVRIGRQISQLRLHMPRLGHRRHFLRQNENPAEELRRQIALPACGRETKFARSAASARKLAGKNAPAATILAPAVRTTAVAKRIRLSLSFEIQQRRIGLPELRDERSPGKSTPAASSAAAIPKFPKARASRQTAVAHDRRRASPIRSVQRFQPASESVVSRPPNEYPANNPSIGLRTPRSEIENGPIAKAIRAQNAYPTAERRRRRSSIAANPARLSFTIERSS